MRLTFLGTGDAAGVPVYGCDCPVCVGARKKPRFFLRKPCSALLEVDDERILLDAGISDLAHRFPAGTPYSFFEGKKALLRTEMVYFSDYCNVSTR